MKKVKTTFIFFFLFASFTAFATYTYNFTITKRWMFSFTSPPTEFTFSSPLISNTSWQRITKIYCRVEPKGKIKLIKETKNIILNITATEINTSSIILTCEINGSATLSPSYKDRLSVDKCENPVYSTFIPENETSSLEKLITITNNIHHYISYSIKYKGKNRSVYEILASKQGVCRDYANVFQAVSSCAGLTTNFVSGYLIKNDSIEPHAWNTVLINNNTIPVDPTSNEIGTYFLPKIAEQIVVNESERKKGLAIAEGVANFTLKKDTYIRIFNEKRTPDVSFSVNISLDKKKVFFTICNNKTSTTIVKYDIFLPFQFTDKELSGFMLVNGCKVTDASIESVFLQPMHTYSVTSVAYLNGMKYKININYSTVPKIKKEINKDEACPSFWIVVALILIVACIQSDKALHDQKNQN